MALIRSPQLAVFLALYAGFWVFSFLIDYETLNLATQSFMLSASIAVLWVYRKPGLVALKKKIVDREDHLVLGICIAWLGVFLRSGTIIIWRTGLLGNDPDAQISTDWINSFNFMILLGAVLHVTAPSATRAGGIIAPWALVLAIGSGVLLCALLLLYGVSL